MFDGYIYIQILTLVISTLLVVYVSFWIHNHKEYWTIGVPMLAYLCHNVIYYGLLFYVQVILGSRLSIFFGIENLSEIWSATLRLHGITTFLLLLLIITNCIKSRNIKHE